MRLSVVAVAIATRVMLFGVLAVHSLVLLHLSLARRGNLTSHLTCSIVLNNSVACEYKSVINHTYPQLLIFGCIPLKILFLYCSPFQAGIVLVCERL